MISRSMLAWAGGVIATFILLPFAQEIMKQVADNLHVGQAIIARWDPTLQWLSKVAHNRFYLAVVMLALGAFAHRAFARFRSQKNGKQQGAEVGAAKQSLVSEAHIFEGFRDRLPEFSGRFAENGRNGQLYLEVSAYFIDVMGENGWTVPIKFMIADFLRYVKGQRLAVPLLHSEQGPNYLNWYFGPETSDEQFRFSIGKDVHYRGRVTFLSSDDKEQHIYFVAHAVDELGVAPDIIGQHMWSHASEWERK